MAIIGLAIKVFGSVSISRINDIRSIVKDWLSWSGLEGATVNVV
jgi:hypothetical protein